MATRVQGDSTRKEGWPTCPSPSSALCFTQDTLLFASREFGCSLTLSGPLAGKVRGEREKKYRGARHPLPGWLEVVRQSPRASQPRDSEERGRSSHLRPQSPQTPGRLPCRPF